jgi:ATP/maltotriose-dependent transcriptional regulator MalT
MTLHNRGPVSVIGENELRFTTEEIYKIAAIMNVEEITPEVKKSLLAANGWPSATTMLIEHVAKKKTSIDFEKIVSTDSNPLKALAMYMLRTIPPEEKSFLVKLSIVSEFTHELAEAILGKEYSYDAINQIAIKGTFFSQTSDPKQTFIFSELIREVLLVELRKKPEEKARIHAQLVEFYEERNQPNRVLEHAYLAGKSDKVGEIFPDAARVLLDTGKGDELLRWSIFAGDISPIGLLKRGTVELTGYLALGDYRNVKRLIETLRFNSQGTELESFISQFATRSQMYLDLKDGRFQEMVENFDLAFLDIGTPIEIGATEKIAQFRLKAIRSFILEEGHEVEAIYEEAKQLADFSRSESNSIFLSSMKAMALYESGDFRRAYEAAQISVNHARSAGYVGVMAPLETLYVIARCQLEFARPDDALRTLQEIRTLSENSKQWIWYFTAEGFIARHFVYQGRFVEALEVVKNAREFANEKNDSLSALWIIDLSEVLIRFFMRDHERLEVLLDRVPNTRFVQQVRFSYHERIGRKTLDKDFENLPAKTPHERMWKHLAEASINLDRESVAIKEMKKALEIGAVIGAKETFLRQEPELGNLIIKIAGESPTVYLEDLATAMTERIRLNTMESTSLTSSLTKREIEVLRHLSTERPISAIAATLHISLNTMKTHLKNLYRKMEVDGRVAAVEKARAHFIL